MRAREDSGRRRFEWAALAGCLLVIAAVQFVTLNGQAVGWLDAAERGHMAALRSMIETPPAEGLDVNATGVDGTAALHWAVYYEDLDTVSQLLDAGADVDAANIEGVTPLAMAALYGNVPIVERLLAAGADASQRGAANETMLMRAARNGDPEAVQVFIDAGVDLDARENRRGTTALMWAAEQGHVEAVQVLIDAGADVSLASAGAGLPRNYIAPRVNTARVEEAAERHQRALAAGRTYEEQLEWEQEQGLLPRGRGFSFADFAAFQNANNRNNDAAESDSDDDGNEDDAVVIAGLVGSGGGGLTPLVYAAREGHLEVARAVLDGGADVDQTTEYGWTPLLTATNNRNYRLAALLIERGADVNLANKGGWTPLYLATDNRNIEGGDYPVPRPDMDHLELIRLLLDNGADPNIPARENTLSRTIFTMQWFYEDGATPFIRAAQSSDLELMTLLLEHGADPMARTANGDTALTAAGGIGWVEGVTYERSPEENYATMEFLLDLGLDVNGANEEGRTALMGAAMKGRSDVVQMLVDRGAKLDQRDGGSRDTHTAASLLAGHTWEAIDYADGLVRVGVQSAVARPETAALIRKLMMERGMPVPPPDRVVESICVVELCQERQPHND